MAEENEVQQHNDKEQLKAAVVSLGSKSSYMVVEEMQKLFSQVDHLNLKSFEINFLKDSVQILYEGNPIEDYDCVYLKGSFRYAQLIQSLSYALQGKTYIPIDPHTFSTGHNKLLTQLVLQLNNIQMPQTYISATPEAGKNLLKNINYPIILKFPDGTHGKGVMIADSFPAASSMLDAFLSLNKSVIIQEYVDTGGKDVRAIVVGDQVVGAMERTAEQGEVRSNVHAGGTGKAVKLDEETTKVAVKAAKVIGADICAVDLLKSHKGPMVIEVNLSPGLQGITKYSKINVAEKIAQFFYQKAQEFKKAKELKKVGIFQELELDEADTENAYRIVSNLDFRGNRILLPEVVTNTSKFNESDEVEITVKKHGLEIKK